MIEASEQTFSFADFELDTSRRVLLKNGETVALNAKTLDLLCVLIENHGRIVTKDELLEKVWEGQFVEENNLTVQISALRKIFGEKKGEHRFIVTIPGKGYKFVHELNENIVDEIIVETHKFERITIEQNIENEDSDAIEKYQTKQLIPLQKAKTSNFSFRYVYLSLGIGIFIFFAAFAFWKTDSKVEINPLKFTKLTSTGKVANAAITPDGKYAVFAQTENGGESLWIKHLATGSQNQIMKPLTVNYVGLTISPDSNFIYASVFSNNLPDTQVWRIPLLGGANEIIQGVISGVTVSFSPDGNSFAFIRSHSSEKENLLQIYDLTNQNVRVLARAKDEIRSFPNFRASPLAWSPDGAEIACVVQEKTNEDVVRTGILLINAETGAERFITQTRWGFIGDLAWINNDELAFTASESNEGQIWTVSRKNGQTKRITNDLNNYTWLSVFNGNFLTLQKTVVTKINAADFDFNSKQIQTRQILEESGYISNGAWTNDGRILYSSTSGGKPEIWRMNADGSDKQQLTVNSSVAFGISVSPIDNSILYSTSENSKNSLFLADSEGKNPRRLFEGTEDIWGNF
nr:winged helix-turn-helix domain-containing protein [Pyrinomonadaceae bacterium]